MGQDEALFWCKKSTASRSILGPFLYVCTPSHPISLHAKQVPCEEKCLEQRPGRHFVQGGSSAHYLLQIALAVELHGQDCFVVVGPEVQYIDDMRMP